jgi:hypothetical protein
MAYTGGMTIPALLQWLWSRKAQAFGVPEKATDTSDRAREAERLPDRDESYYWLAHSYLPW